MRRTLLAALFSLALPGVGASTAAEPDLLLGHICQSPAPAIAGPHRLVMLPHMGNDHFPADTAVPEAQRWFDYGLTLGRSFEHADAVLAFQKAEALDPTCSLCVWGEGWARGPTINFGVDAAQRDADLALAKRAQALAGAGATPTMRALEAALVERYVADPKAGNRAWAAALDALHASRPQDVEIAVFDAEAWLIRENDGDADAPGRALAAVAPLVPQHPDDTGLVHFFIHASEEAGQPQLAAPYAARMAELASGASHMVHMPSHTWFRIGRYETAAEANAAALDADLAYAKATDYPTPLGRKTYHAHDVQFGLGAAMISGDSPLALRFVSQLNTDFPQPGTYAPWVELAAGHAYAALGRFAEPSQALAATARPQAKPFVEAMRHYARAEADLRLGRIADARAEAAQVAPLADAKAAASTPGRVVRIARLALDGDLAMAAHDPARAAAAFGQAASLQDALFQAHEVDPPAWWYPMRRSLAAALLAQGDAAAAEREADKALAAWPGEPVTLAVLAKAQAARHEAAASASAAQARAGWRGAPRELDAWFLG